MTNLFASGGHNKKGILRKNMELKLRDEFIKLGQAMKAAGIVSSGIDAKMLIQDGQVTVNGEVETRRGRKLYDGDVFEFEGDEVRVVK